ncbi:hypothetical protein ACFOPQ_01070, partial [Deinococcus antarcticus]
QMVVQVEVCMSRGTLSGHMHMVAHFKPLQVALRRLRRRIAPPLGVMAYIPGLKTGGLRCFF